MRKRFRALIVLALSAVPIAGSTSQSFAAITQTDLNSNSQTGFDANILNTDLINQGRPSFASLTATAGATFPASGSNEGTATNPSGLTFYSAASTADLVYNLNLNTGTGGSATGYNITAVNGIYGWQDSRSRHAAQRWTMAVSTIAVPAFTDIRTVLYDPFTDNLQGSTQVTLTDLSGPIATGVTAIRFRLGTDNGTEVGVVREFDVTGAATPVPEPVALSLLALGAVGLLARRRTR